MIREVAEAFSKDAVVVVAVAAGVQKVMVRRDREVLVGETFIKPGVAKARRIVAAVVVVNIEAKGQDRGVVAVAVIIRARDQAHLAAAAVAVAVVVRKVGVVSHGGREIVVEGEAGGGKVLKFRLLEMKGNLNSQIFHPSQHRNYIQIFLFTKVNRWVSCMSSFKQAI